MVYKKKRSAKVGKSVKKYVKRVLDSQVEDKYIDSTITALTPSYTPTVGQLGLPFQGTGEDDRIGDKIKPTSIVIEGNIQGPNTHVFRLVVFKWKPYSTPVAGDIFTSAFLGTFNAVNAPYEYKSRDMYQILYDKKFDISASGPNIKSFRKVIRSKKLSPINFTGTNTTTGTNKIWYALMQDGIATLNSVYMNMRIFYEDA